MGKKYYAVANGRSNGIYGNWDDCKSQVDGYSGARFKSFPTKQAAQAFVNSNSGNSGSYSGSSYSGSSYSGSSYSGSSYSGSSYNTNRSSYSSGSRSSNYGSSSSGGRGYNSSSSSSYGGGYTSSNYSPPRVSKASARTSAPSERQVVYTDGSALGNGKSGSRAGWGVYWGANDSRNSSGKVLSGEQTNNRGELGAIEQAVKQIQRETASGKRGSYEIRADSQYSRDALGKWANSWETNGWKTSTGAAVKNRDIIEPTRRDIQALRDQGVDVQVSYVPGHAGHAGNEAADELARRAAGS